MLFGLATIAVGLIAIGWSLWNKLTGVPEWRPGAHTDSLLLSSAITTMIASGLCLIPAPDASVPIAAGRRALGLALLGVSVVCFVWHIARLG
jgi:hypothetical protein